MEHRPLHGHMYARPPFQKSGPSLVTSHIKCQEVCICTVSQATICTTLLRQSFLLLAARNGGYLAAHGLPLDFTRHLPVGATEKLALRSENPQFQRVYARHNISCIKPIPMGALLTTFKVALSLPNADAELVIAAGLLRNAWQAV